MELISLLTILQIQPNNEIVTPLGYFLGKYSGAISIGVGEFLGKYSGAIAIGVAIVIFLYQRHRTIVDKKERFDDRLRRICTTLLIDVDVFEKWLFGNETPKEKIGDKEYTQNMLSEENYHSVVNSGLNIYFEKGTQEQLVSLYHYVALHNKRVELMSNILHLNWEDIDWLWHSHEQQLALYEEELKKRLPAVKKCLEDELNSLKKNS